MAHRSERDLIEKTKNTSRFFTENQPIAWVLLIGTLLWGVLGYASMPKRKDPEVPVRVAAALLSWPGATAQDLEERGTRLVERRLAENAKIEHIESTTRAGVAVITITLDRSVQDTGRELDDVWLKLNTLSGLPEGATLTFMKDFGDTAALMLTVASPRASPLELQLRADTIARAIVEVRRDAQTADDAARVTLLAALPLSAAAGELGVVGSELAAWAAARGARDVRVISGQGYLGIDALTRAGDAKLLEHARTFFAEHLRAAELHPDLWPLAVIRDPAQTEQRLGEVAGDKYSYRELDTFTEQLQRALQALPEVAKVTRSGVLGDAVYLEYSQAKLAAHGVLPAQLQSVLAARNVAARAGSMELSGKSVLIAPSGELTRPEELGAMIVAQAADGAPVYLRDLASISRGYEPPQYLAYATSRDASGQWQRARAITLALSMKSGLQVADFGRAVQARLADARELLPEDLRVQSVSDQPLQVRENVALFMSSLYEAIALVVLVALLGFWEWRSALLMASSIPITLAMTFGLMRLLGIDVQQVSIASLIIALGLLVDDPVVAGDAIKRDLNRGLPARIAAWLGPTKLANAILFATLTNIVAYLPFLTLPGDSGRFIHALPLVLTASLVASRLVSMSFIPLLGLHLLRPSKRPEPPLPQRRQRGFARVYGALVRSAIQHRFMVLGAAVLLLALGAQAVRGVKQAFFPKDLSYLSYVDVWLPEDAPVTATREVAVQVDAIVREIGAAHGVESVTTFVGGGGPRFWYSLSPEQRQANYAQLVVRVRDKHQTARLVGPLQAALSARVAGARVDVRELESGPAVGVPVSIRVTGEDIGVLRELGGQVERALRATGQAARIRDNWGADNLDVSLRVDPDRASLAGVTHLDVARATAAAMSGMRVGSLHEGDHELPIVARLRASERQTLADVGDLYVYSSQNARTKLPLRQVAELSVHGSTAKIVRRDHVRTLTVGAFPVAGVLPSEVLARAEPALAEIARALPTGYQLQIGGEQAEQQRSFKDLAQVLLISIAAIYLTLVLQFRDACKPLIVFAAIPFGVIASLLGLLAMHAPFGFMAFLGVISLIGVIVSHVIVLFDFIEEERAAGTPLRDALIDAGIMRLRPVLVTVAATVLGLIPLALHGGPLWEPLCYVQIAGLTAATVVTLLLVPVLYATFVLDLGLVRWSAPAQASARASGKSPWRLSRS